jgi:hypothetical protein
MHDTYETPFDCYETPFDGDRETRRIDAALDRIDAALAEMAARLDRIEALLDQMNGRLDRLLRMMRRLFILLFLGLTVDAPSASGSCSACDRRRMDAPQPPLHPLMGIVLPRGLRVAAGAGAG